MERPGKEDLASAATEAFSLLTRTVPAKVTVEELSWADETEAEETEKLRQEMLDEVGRTVKEIFQGKEFTDLDLLRPFFPSTNANYLTTRRHGGAVGHIMESELLDGLTSEENLIKWDMEGKGRSERVTVDGSNLFERFRVLMYRLIEKAKTEEKKVTLVAIAEALKVRVISKGPVCTYTSLKPLQVWLWRTLKNHPSGVFQLIGEEITDEYLCSQLGELREDEGFLSGDYKAATDNLDPEFSERAVKEINKYIKVKELHSLFLGALTGHLIQNPDHPDEFSGQTWGQLMGSIVSFPILCVINAAICRRTRERDMGRSLRLQDCKVAVNGDDAHFALNWETETCGNS